VEVKIMKFPKTALLAAAVIALAAGSSRAQLARAPETIISDAIDQARAAVAASAKPITSCPDAKELETPFQLTVTFADGRKPLNLSFEYEGCEERGRNDYLPPYTERSYKGADSYGLTIVTNDDETDSEVLVSKGADWVGRFGKIENATLLSGNPLAAGTVEKGKAVLRDSAKPVYPQLKACESAVGAPRDAAGYPETGYGSNGPSLVLLTNSAAYYYHQDCDICAEVTKCELATGKLSSAIAAHSVDCGDLKPYSKDAVYDACADGASR
jgi:hypothetical protein